MFDRYHGMQLIECPHFTKLVTVDRTWRERLLSCPWQPWIKTKVISEPSPDLYMMDGAIAGHPQTLMELRNATAPVRPTQ